MRGMDTPHSNYYQALDTIQPEKKWHLKRSVGSRRIEMRKRIGYFILIGLAIGAVFGVFLGSAIGSNTWGIILGALAGLFLGWYIGAAVIARRIESMDE
jgi:F0F1-type ATP synthase assembly protein I